MDGKARLALTLWLCLVAACCFTSCDSNDSAATAPSATEAEPSTTAPAPSAVNADEPPPATREFRAMWVATVGNIDWPSAPGLTTEQQQREAIRILDRAREINLNAIILQVRPTADALYDSKLEPWSAYLTGTMGKPPEPRYDPLAFWIEQAHARGIELHAWFNPYRARNLAAKIAPSRDHVTRARPDLVRGYGQYEWMDPGEPESADHVMRVMMDVVERYDVDGIHIDDYFYPYPELKNPADKNDKTLLPFPDDASYQKYTAAGGKLPRDDWRRDNINRLVRRAYDGIKQRKTYARFGISPFGIPRPGLPGIETVKGLDQYERLYADAVLWLRNGWCDYLVPQLYWKIAAPEQPYLGLLEWWANHNPAGRHVYGGLFTSRIDLTENSWSADEILNQVVITRLTRGARGNAHFSAAAVSQDRRRIATRLRDGLYAEPALVPAATWLDSDPPLPPRDLRLEYLPHDATPVIAAQTSGPATTAATKPATVPFVALVPRATATSKAPLLRVSWSPGSTEERAWLWTVYWRQGKTWKLRLASGRARELIVPAGTRIAVAAVDRCGNESDRVVIDTGLEKD